MNKKELVKNLTTIKEINTQLALGTIQNYHIDTLVSSRKINPDLLREIYKNLDKYVYSNSEYSSTSGLLHTIMTNPKCPTDIIMNVWNKPVTRSGRYPSIGWIGKCLAVRHPNFDTTLIDDLIKNIDYYTPIPLGESLMMNPNLTDTQYQTLFLSDWELTEKASRLKRTTLTQLKIILINCMQSIHYDMEIVTKIRRNVLDRLLSLNKLKIIE